MTIIVGYLPTPEGKVALSHAGREAVIRRQPLTVVDLSHHGSPLDAHHGTPLDPSALPGEVEEVRGRLAAERLELLVHPSAGLEPSDELIRAAQETEAELIVIGLPHRTRVGKFLFGSYAQRVLLDADCPVLSVKAEAMRA
jgi:nucleotide-binding universal stress UspA family protein